MTTSHQTTTCCLQSYTVQRSLRLHFPVFLPAYWKVKHASSPYSYCNYSLSPQAFCNEVSIHCQQGSWDPMEGRQSGFTASFVIGRKPHLGHTPLFLASFPAFYLTVYTVGGGIKSWGVETGNEATLVPCEEEGSQKEKLKKIQYMYCQTK